MITPFGCTRCKKCMHASWQLGSTFVWRYQTRQGWFHFSKGRQNNGSVDQYPLAPPPLRGQVTASSYFCEHCLVLRKGQGNPVQGQTSFMTLSISSF